MANSRIRLQIGIVLSATALVLAFVNCSQPNSAANGGEAANATPEGEVVISSYYVDATLGDDSNEGTSMVSPWKSLQKVSNSTLPSNSVIYLKRGEVWYEQLDIPNSNLTIDAYGSGALPLIDGSGAASAWTDLGGGIYGQTVSLSSGEALGNISENGVMMTPVDWLGNASSSFSGKPTGTYTFDPSSQQIFIQPAANPATKAYRLSRKLYGISAIDKSNVTIQNIHISRFSLNGINYQKCLQCSVSSTLITNGGGVASGANPSAPPAYIYAGNGIEYDTNSVGGTVEGVTIQDIFDSCISPQTYANRETVSDLEFKDSTLDKCGFAGVEISILSNGGTAGSRIENILISGLTIRNSGQGWSGRRYGSEGHGIRVMADAGAGTMSGISIEQTVISGSAGSGVKIAGELGLVRMNRLSLSDNLLGINVQDAASTSLLVRLTSSLIYNNRGYGFSYNAPTSSGLQVVHNTFSDNSTIQLAIFNQSGEARIQNNIFYGSGPVTHLYSSAALVQATVNNNCYNNVANMIGYNGSAYSTLGSFQAATGLESAGVAGTVGLANPAAENFTLQSSSQCRGQGSALTGVTKDYSGNPFVSPPAAGAFEY